MLYCFRVFSAVTHQGQVCVEKMTTSFCYTILSRWALRASSCSSGSSGLGGLGGFGFGFGAPNRLNDIFGNVYDEARDSQSP